MNNDTAINEIQKTIEEIRHKGEHHAEFVRSNGELVISGLEMALDILNSINPEPCDDTISRHAAIEALGHMMDTDGFRDGWAVSRANVDCMLRALPSAQPEDWMEQNKDRILKAGMEGREVEFKIGGRLFAIREKAQ